MNIQFIGQYFPPEMGALASRASELAEIWAEAGQQVTVLTGFPNYPSGEVPEEYRDKLRRIVFQETVNNYRVVRTWLTTLSNDKAYARILGYISFFISSLITGIFLSKSDVIIASSPPLTVGMSGWLISKIKCTPFVLEIRDLWPDSITASGASKEGSLLVRILRWMALFLYQNSDCLVVVSPAFEKELVDRHGIHPELINIIPNGVKLDSFILDPFIPLRQELFKENDFVVSYIGNYGWAQGLQTVLEAAEKLQKSNPEIQFLFIGGGADEDRLKSSAIEKYLTNIRFIPQQPKDTIPKYIQISDVCLVPLRDAPVFETVIPSKMLEFMAGSKPIILGVRGQAQLILEEARAGISIPPQDPEALVDAIMSLYQDSDLRQGLGKNGRKYIQKNFKRELLAESYLELLHDIVQMGRDS